MSAIGLGGLGVTCTPRDPMFAGSNSAEVDGFFQDIKILSTSPPGGTLGWGSRVWHFRLVKEPQAWKIGLWAKFNRRIHALVYLNSREHNRSEKGRSALGSNDHPIKTNTKYKWNLEVQYRIHKCYLIFGPYRMSARSSSSLQNGNAGSICEWGGGLSALNDDLVKLKAGITWHWTTWAECLTYKCGLFYS